MDWDDVPKLYSANYRVNIGWRHIEEWTNDHLTCHIEEWINDHLTCSIKMGCEIEPDFQRSHDTWSEAKRIAYVEYQLSGGPSAKEIQWNCPGWMQDFRGPLQLVDGLQRLTSVRMFLRNELKAFGTLYKDFTGSKLHVDCIFFINNLSTRREVLTWYLQLNRGGVVHTDEEIARVEALLAEELK